MRFGWLAITASDVFLTGVLGHRIYVLSSGISTVRMLVIYSANFYVDIGS
jgi:hypothetical protein